jgi:hypothetical protein
MLGVFDIIFAKSIPAVHPQCSVAVRLRLTPSEQSEHKVAINLIQKDGQNIIPPMEVSLKFALERDLPTGGTNCIFNIQGMRLERFGEYSINLAVDGKHLDSIPLYIKQVG